LAKFCAASCATKSSSVISAPTAILSALKEEQQGLIELLEQPHKIKHASRDFWLGRLHGQPVVLGVFGVRAQIHRALGTPFGCDALHRHEIGV